MKDNFGKESFRAKYSGPEHIHELIRQGNATMTRQAMWDSPFWDKSHAEASVHSEHADIRESIALHGFEQIDKAHYAKFQMDPSNAVRGAFFHSFYKARPKEWLHKYINDPKTHPTHAHAAMHAGGAASKFSVEELDHFAYNHPVEGVRRSASAWANSKRSI